MAPSKAPSSWSEEDSDSSSGAAPTSPPLIVRRPVKFDDEEGAEDVLDDWMDQEDSEVEREKAAKAAQAKAAADAQAKAEKKSKAQRIEEKRQAALRRKLEEEGEASSEDEDESVKRQRARAAEKEADLKNAEDLFGAGSTVGMLSNARGEKKITVQAGTAMGDTVDLSALELFQPKGVAAFAKLRETLVPLLVAHSKKPSYPGFATELAKQLCKDLSSEQIKKVASGLTALSNEKMREEKAAEKGGKKSKAAKSKVTLNASRDVSRVADTMAYDDDGLDDGDFM